ncbi:hypothetical protein C6P45_000727 [Maudiozyma exigua]|uniref:U3 small nucleolar RNA-associated protein 8 n=1 Tax=Maudiozyma exigua TaxID=34358 RepID=A0A9P6W6P0_MAUEX|nr:hypothetical protein C6P45_000727 [Kazachstania exigua]
MISASVITIYDLKTNTELRSRNNISIENAVFKLFKGKLYKYNKVTFSFELYDITTLNLLHSISIPFIPKDVKSVTFAVVGENRVVLTVDNVAYLLDLYLGSVITTITFKHLKWFKLLEGVEGSFVLGISCTSNSGELKLEIVNVELGSCNLKDSLGKSFKNFVKTANEDKLATISLKPLLLGDVISENKTKPNAVTFNYNDILKKLKKNSSNKDAFDKIFFKELNIEKEHYTEKDRFIINEKFLADVLDIILENFSFDDSNEYPKALAFLLTHPLFPIIKTKGLLAKFKEQPTLYKQTIVTCPNLPLDELLKELFTINNNELSLDISLRILEDYTTDSIKGELKKLPKVEIENYIEFIIENDSESDNIEQTSEISNSLFSLLSLVIDSVGLFALEGRLLGNLTQFITRKVKIAETNAELLYVIDTKTSEFTSSQHSHNNSNNSNTNRKKKLLAYTVEYLDL